MAAPPDRLRLKVLLGAVVAAGFAWLAVPGGTLDKLAFKLVARGFANPPLFVTGFGSRGTPWNLRTFSATAESDPRHAPLLVALGDDPEGIFQSSPPSPVDMAVVFSNFQRLGARKAASAAVLAWDEPDVIGLAALEKTLGKFESLVMAAPVTRGASPQPLPPEFRRASLPLSAVAGDASLIPQVNRIPLPDVVLGGQLAGFQVIDSETQGPAPFLLARWDDRVIFAFPLMVVLQRLGIPVDKVEIRPGEHLKLGKDGPVVPIDRHGRMVVPAGKTKPFARIAAEALIDGGDDLFPRQAPDPVILLDDRGSAEPATRAFSRGLSPVVAAIASDSGMSRAKGYPRPRALMELLLLLILCGLCTATAGLGGLSARICWALLGTMLAVAQCVGFSAGWWLPGPAGVVVLVISWGLAAWFGRTSLKRQMPAVVAPAVDPSDDHPVPDPACDAPKLDDQEILPEAPVEASFADAEPVVEELPAVAEAPVNAPPAIAEAPIEESPATPAKKKARTPRRKPAAGPVADPPAAASPEPAAPKPKRTRTRKPPAGGEAAAEPPAKPARKTARKSAARKKPDPGD